MVEAAKQFSIAAPSFEERRYAELRRRSAAPGIGRLSIAGVQNEGTFNPERRRYDEVTSALAEALSGSVKTEYSFKLRSGQLVAEDGEEIEELGKRGFNTAVKLASADNFFALFLPQRARYELDEIREDQAMARGKTAHNTTIKFSPYTEELDTTPENREKLIIAGQKPYWQRGMFRLKHWDEKTQELHMITLSIDNSSVKFLHDIAKEVFDYKYIAEDSTGTLGETIRLNIQNNSWRKIPDIVAAAADKKLAREKGGRWLQGRSEQDALQTQKFVESQTAIIEHVFHVDKILAWQHSTFESYLEAFHNELYNQVALLEDLQESSSENFTGSVAMASAVAGELAREDGRVYDMCGLVLDGGNKEANLAAKTGLELLSLLRLAGQLLRCTNPNCRQKVIVPTADLEQGKLTCSKCGLVYDVCSKKSSFNSSKIRSEQQPARSGKESDWQRIKREAEENKQAQKQAKVIELAKKRQQLARQRRNQHRQAV